MKESQDEIIIRITLYRLDIRERKTYIQAPWECKCKMTRLVPVLILLEVLVALRKVVRAASWC